MTTDFGKEILSLFISTLVCVLLLTIEVAE
jgi:hypothetical protein